MGIELQDLKSLMMALSKNSGVLDGDLLVLGDAVLHFSPKQMEDLAGKCRFPLHQIPIDMSPVTLGSTLGFRSTETLDINGRATITLDLQQEIPEDLYGRFSCIIDAGVLFWCYDPGAVLRNIYRLTKPDGLIMHITAISGHYGRGYYNIHPRLLEEFYSVNSCSYIQASFRTKPWWRDYLIAASRLFGIKADKYFVTYTTQPGRYFLQSSSFMKLSFSDRIPKREVTILANNVVGTFVFKKTSQFIEPRGMIQLC